MSSVPFILQVEERESRTAAIAPARKGRVRKRRIFVGNEGIVQFDLMTMWEIDLIPREAGTWGDPSGIYL